MGITSNIIALIIKSAVNSRLGDGLCSELINIPIDEYSGRGVEKIKDFISGEKSKIDNVLSKDNMKLLNVNEDNVEFVTSEIKDLLSKVEITDGLLRNCRYNQNHLKDFLWEKYNPDKDIIENESDIKKGLDAVAEALIKLIRASEEFEENFLVQISNSVDDVNVKLQDITDYMEKNGGKLDENIQVILEILRMIMEQNRDSDINEQNIQKKIRSRTQEYFDKWDANMFLNDFDKRDENAGVNVKLREVYLDEYLPPYIWKGNKKEDFDLKDLLSEYIYNKHGNKMLLILGQPGIGKSTLITWITANFSDKADDILVYKFAPDLVDTDWLNTGLLHRILEKLGYKYSELNRKILILDGLDEVSIANRRGVLDALYDYLIYGNHIENFLLIITCRENYIEGIELLKCKYITLHPWDEEQIRSFSCIFQKKAKNQLCESTIEKAVEIRDVFGIPLILYIVLALNISIEKEGSIVDVYDKIFSLEGGIYDRCIDNKKFADSHRIGEVKKQIHQISKSIAIWMFENEPEEAYIPKEEYQIICANIMQESKQQNEAIQHDFLIGNYFKLVRYCEGFETEKLYFVHRSIYEYFVVETIFTLMYEALDISKERLAFVFGKTLKKGTLSTNILDYLKHKIMGSKLNSAFNIVNETFQLMLQDGMTYYTGECYKNVIECEMNVFANMLEIIHLWKDECLCSGNSDSKRDICRYINFNRDIILNLKLENLIGAKLNGADLREADLRRANLNEADLTRAKLRRANLIGARLRRTNLIEADLTGAYINRVNLIEANLIGAKLNGADLREADLRGANLRDANLIGAYINRVNLIEANLIGANLKRADLREADLRGADLSGTDLFRVILNGAILTSAIFDERQVKYLEERYNLQGTQVVINNTLEVVSYEKYCHRRKRMK